ncbi:metallophosphoesterase [soil metagenome]
MTGLGLAGYAFYEPFRYRLTTKDVICGAACPPLDVLHISDTHMRAGDRKLAHWLESLPDALGEPPDLVLATGDLIEENEGIDTLLDSLNAIEARLGRFYVFGSHDYYVSTFKPYTKYFRPSTGPAESAPADTERLREGLSSKGWISLINTTHLLDSPHGRIRLAGVDDPYLKRHTTEHIRRAGDEVLAIGLVHAPDVVSEWVLAGFDLVVAGHTHAGQVRVPGFGALVTNCSLPNALAGGLHRVGDGYLHVSPGLGAGKYSPVRFACRPEATRLRLRPA